MNDEKEMKMRGKKRYHTAIAQQEEKKAPKMENVEKQPEEGLTAMETRGEELEKENGDGLLTYLLTAIK